MISEEIVAKYSRVAAFKENMHKLFPQQLHGIPWCAQLDSEHNTNDSMQSSPAVRVALP